MRKQEITSQKTYPYLFLFIFLLVGLSVIVYQTNTRQSQEIQAQITLRNCNIPDSDLAPTAEEQQMLDGINAYRQRQGVRPLNYSPALKRPAKWFANDLQRTQNIMPMDSLGRDLGRRLMDCGLINREYGEILGTGTAEERLQGWINSPENELLAFPAFVYVGIAKTGNFWVVEFVETQVPTVILPATTNVPSPMRLGGQPSVPSPTPCPVSQMSANSQEDITAMHRRNKSKKQRTSNYDGLLKRILQLLEQILVILGGGTAPQNPEAGGSQPADGGTQSGSGGDQTDSGGSQPSGDGSQQDGGQTQPGTGTDQPDGTQQDGGSAQPGTGGSTQPGGGSQPATGGTNGGGVSSNPC